VTTPDAETCRKRRRDRPRSVVFVPMIVPLLVRRVWIVV
jgi:hypothetical protein